MNRPDTNELIAALSGGLQPVRRLRPPLRRAASWLLLAALLAAWPVAHYSNLPLFTRAGRRAAPDAGAQATLLTGIVALYGAFT
jgi:hypothetical protein